ncbi:MAG TPA: hypothetical protein PKD85_05280 [Saprospiraceae bacterium]|nr:hypothetical protein [Saprospiraceae bacterium]
MLLAITNALLITEHKKRDDIIPDSGIEIKGIISIPKDAIKNITETHKRLSTRTAGAKVSAHFTMDTGIATKVQTYLVFPFTNYVSNKWTVDVTFALYPSFAGISSFVRFGIYADSTGQLYKFVTITPYIGGVYIADLAPGASYTVVNGVVTIQAPYTYPSSGAPYINLYGYTTTWYLLEDVGVFVFSVDQVIAALSISSEYTGTASCSTFPGSHVSWTQFKAYYGNQANGYIYYTGNTPPTCGGAILQPYYGLNNGININLYAV